MTFAGSLTPGGAEPRDLTVAGTHAHLQSSIAQSTLLCVGDEPGALASMRQLFERHGYRVITAGNGRDGLEILLGQRVDLILSDMHQIEMDGFEFLARARDHRPDIVRLILTDRSDIAATIAAANRGEISRYVVKPLMADDLLLTVRRSLERSVLERENKRLEFRNEEQRAELCALKIALQASIEARTEESESASRVLAHDNGASMHDHRESVEALRQSRQLLDNIVDNIPTAVQLKSVHDGFRVVMWNKAAEAVYGVTRDLAVGRNVHDLCPKEDADRMHAADCELVASGGARDYPDRIAYTKHRGTTRLHLRKTLLCDASGTPTHLLVIADDITARIAAETKLRESEARFRGLTELSSDWYWEQDEEFRGTHRTYGIDTAAGAPLSSFYGERRWDIKNAAPLKGTWDDHKAILNAHMSYRDFEYRVLLADGLVGYRSVSGEPIFDPNGKFVGYRGIGRNITAQKSAEESLLRTNAELSELNTKVSQVQAKLLQSEKLASIGQLAAGVAHEINNPIGYIFSNFRTLERYLENLFAMLSAYEAAESTHSSPETAAELAALRHHVDLEYLKEEIPAMMAESKEGIVRVKKIVQDLKDFSRVDADQDWQPADLHQCINSTLNIANNEIKYKADVVREYGTIPYVECLPSQINQVILNLLVNAAHAIGQERGRITIRTGSEDGHVWFTVTDTGCGIPKEIQMRVFEPFFTTKPVGQGTGLGLSLSYGIVQDHLGGIDVESSPGCGTTFRVTLPIKRPAPAVEAVPLADTEVD